MKYFAAYTLLVLGGKDKPTADDIKVVFDSVSAEFDSETAEKLVSELSSKVIDISSWN
jgi:large subunit ribosomal protein LP2